MSKKGNAQTPPQPSGQNMNTGGMGQAPQFLGQQQAQDGQYGRNQGNQGLFGGQQGAFGKPNSVRLEMQQPQATGTAPIATNNGQPMNQTANGGWSTLAQPQQQPTGGGIAGGQQGLQQAFGKPQQTVQPQQPFIPANQTQNGGYQAVQPQSALAARAPGQTNEQRQQQVVGQALNSNPNAILTRDSQGRQVVGGYGHAMPSVR